MMLYIEKGCILNKIRDFATIPSDEDAKCAIKILVIEIDIH